MCNLDANYEFVYLGRMVDEEGEWILALIEGCIQKIQLMGECSRHQSKVVIGNMANSSQQRFDTFFAV